MKNTEINQMEMVEDALMLLSEVFPNNPDYRKSMLIAAFNDFVAKYNNLCGIVQEQQREIQELKNRNAELRGMYVHSAREAETYKQFCEQKDKQIEKMMK